MKIHTFWFCMIAVIVCAEDKKPQLIKIDEDDEDIVYYSDPLEIHCGAGVSPEYDVHVNVYQEFECIKAGYKHIYWGDYLDISIPEIQAYIETLGLKQVTFGDILFENFKHVIVYIPSYERNALLLKKHCLETNVSCYVRFFNTIPRVDTQLFRKFNSYLVGTLLEYKEEDIEYFYKRSAVLDSLIELMGDRMMLPYKQWTMEEQKQFDDLVVANKEWEMHYQNDKKYTHIWLALNASFSLEKLQYQNEIIEKYLESAYKVQDIINQTAVENSIKNEIPSPAIEQSEKAEKVSWWYSFLERSCQFFKAYFI